MTTFLIWRRVAAETLARDRLEDFDDPAKFLVVLRFFGFVVLMGQACSNSQSLVGLLRATGGLSFRISGLVSGLNETLP